MRFVLTLPSIEGGADSAIANGSVREGHVALVTAPATESPTVAAVDPSTKIADAIRIPRPSNGTGRATDDRSRCFTRRITEQTSGKQHLSHAIQTTRDSKSTST